VGGGKSQCLGYEPLQSNAWIKLSAIDRVCGRARHSESNGGNFDKELGFLEA
jgi:hypothetical protein